MGETLKTSPTINEPLPNVWVPCLKCFVLIYLLNAWTGVLRAQQVYPVTVNGVLIPPHSINLSDYANSRSADLFFNVQLNDPVEASVPVRFRLTVVNNGQEILQTDPSFLPLPRQLFQFQPEVLDGATLAPYLTQANLVGNGGTPLNNLIPEGFNQICLEVIHTERGVPISNKACVFGNFRLNEPPLLQQPNCGDELFLTEPSNLFFNWMPLHLGSGNAPLAVEYGLEIIELNPAIADPNDGFSNGLKILETTVMGTTFIYSEAEPYLEPGRTYAWRVQAKDIGGSDLFINQGYSKICTFTYGGTPRKEVSRSCEPFDTDYGRVAAGAFGSADMQTGQIVDLGYFDMEVTNLSGGGSGGYNGEGKVSIPFLNSQVLVDFDGLQINEQGRAFGVKSVEAISTVEIAKNGMADLSNRLSQDETKQRYISARKIDDSDPIDLPLLMDKIETDNRLPNIVLTNLTFSERAAQLTAFATERDKNGDPILFTKENIPFTPYGVAKASLLPLEQNVLIESSGNHTLTYLGKEGAEMRTSLDFDCKGFVKYDLQGTYQFSDQLLRPSSTDKQEVYIRFSTGSVDFYDYLAEVADVPSFQIADNPDYTFELGSGVFDHSITQNPANLKFMEALAWENTPAWQGFVFPSFKVEATNFGTFLGTETAVELTEGELYLTKKGISGRAIRPSNSQIPNRRIRDWAINVNKVGVLFKENEVLQKIIEGQIKIPIIDEPFAYEGTLALGEMESADLKIITEKGYVAGMSLWNAELQFDPSNSLVEIVERRINRRRNLIPYANLQGALNVSFSAEEFKNYLAQKDKEAMIKALKSSLGLDEAPDLEVRNLPLKGLIVDPTSIFEKRYRLKDYELEATQIKMGDKSFKIASIYVSHKKNKEGISELGLNLMIKQGKTLMSLTVWAQANDKNGFTLDRIEIESKELDCDCI